MGLKSTRNHVQKNSAPSNGKPAEISKKIEHKIHESTVVLDDLKTRLNALKDKAPQIHNGLVSKKDEAWSIAYKLTGESYCASQEMSDDNIFTPDFTKKISKEVKKDPKSMWANLERLRKDIAITQTLLDRVNNLVENNKGLEKISLRSKSKGIYKELRSLEWMLEISPEAQLPKELKKSMEIMKDANPHFLEQVRELEQKAGNIYAEYVHNPSTDKKHAINKIMVDLNNTKEKLELINYVNKNEEKLEKIRFNRNGVPEHTELQKKIIKLAKEWPAEMSTNLS